MEKALARGFELKEAWPWILISAALLGLVPIINGGPLFYPDSGTYIREAVFFAGQFVHLPFHSMLLHPFHLVTYLHEGALFSGVVDRPPFYSMFLFFLHLRISLWPIPFVQDLIVCYVIFRVLPTAFPGIKPPRIAIVVVLSGLLTSLPWFSNQVMPDIYTPLIVLIVYALCLRLDCLGMSEQFLISVMLLGMIAFHQANTIFTILVLAAALLLGWLEGIPRQRLQYRALLVVVPLGLAMFGQSLYAYALIKRFKPAPYGPFFMLARLLDDGPAHRYLASVCPAAQYTLCRYQNTLIGGDVFLWAKDSPRFQMIKERGWGGALDEASAIVNGSIRAYPGEVALSALRNSSSQLVHAAKAVDNKCCREWTEQVVAELFPREYPAYMNSLQYRGALPLTFLTWVDGIVLVVSVLFLVGMALTRQRVLAGDSGRLLVLIAWSCFANAALMGALSMVADRFESRIAWLIPLFAFAVLTELLTGKAVSRQELHPEALATE